MAYQEPGVRITQKKSARGAGGTGASLIPVIIGEGPAHIYNKDVAVVRGSGATDTLPFDTVTSIISVGDMRGFSNYTQSVDYTLSAPNAIQWNGSNKPATGATYYVTCTSRPNSSQYEAKLIASFSELDAAFTGHPDGPQFMFTDVSNGSSLVMTRKINPVGLGAYLALESGAPAVYVVQVKPSGGLDNSINNPYMVNEPTDFVTALADLVTFLNDAYRIVPMSDNPTTISAVLNHVVQYSSPDEGLWRAMFSSYDTSTITNTAALVTALVNGAAAYKHFRNSLAYAGTATKKLSDGLYYILNDSYVAAALAGVEATLPPDRPLTGVRLYNFYELKGLKLTRTVKNQIAAGGVLILEQPGGPGTPLFVRHQLTTDMTSIQTREISLVRIHDFVSKVLKAGLSPYVGQYNITADYLFRLDQATKSIFAALIGQGVILDGKVTLLAQDADNPDTVIMEVSVTPPYPANNINITLFLN